MILRKYAIASICAKYSMKHPQKFIADLCGVTQAQVSKWWNIPHDSDYSIPSDKLKQIADFFHIPMEGLYNDTKSSVRSA